MVILINELEFFNLFMFGMVIAGVCIFIMLFFITAGYGQHISEKWGRAINNRAGWAIMEVPAVIVYLILFIIGEYKTPMAFLFLVLWLIHYGYRSFIFPSLIRGKHNMPITIILFGMTFNTANGYLQARWINTLSPGYDISWIFTPMFIVGILVFFSGFLIHVNSDHIIRTLRKPSETEFKVPYGGLFKYVSCPNYLGEIIEWSGWAIMTWSIPGLVFVFWTFSNLAPRARSNHKWYIERFSDYPKTRKALIPFIY